MWLPTPFIGYFSHHDGLMITTVSQIQNAMKTNGQWPFNQYGSFWAFVYAIPTWNVQYEYLLVSMRILTLIFYFLTAWLTYKIGRLFGGPVFSTAAVILLLGNQPFLFDLLPWPSAVSMPIITLISFLLLRKVAQTSISETRRNLEVAVVGVLLPMVILSRVQVGLVLLIISICFVCIYGKINELVFFLSSFFITIGIFFVYLASNGWFLSSLKDQFIFGSTYVGSEANPIPIFTSIGVASIILFFTTSDKIIGKIVRIGDKRKIVPILALLFFLFIIPMIAILAKRGMNPHSMYVLFIHRFWISLILGGVIYFSIVQTRKTYIAWQRRDKFDKKLQSMNLLALLSITSQLQVYPLFDQMHSWWGSTPGVVVLLLIFKEKFQALSNLVQRNQLFAISTLTAVFLLSIIPFVIQSWSLEKQISSRYLGGIFLSENTDKEMTILQKVFEKNVTPGTMVLNLCPDPDIFLTSKYRLSESRVFVFWPEFLKSDYLRKTFQGSSPQFIVTCFSESTNTIKLETIREYADINSSNYVLLDSPANLLGHDWQIWKRFTGHESGTDHEISGR